MDITDLKQNFSGKSVYVGTFIGNYDKGGHKISMNITINPSESLLNKTNVSIPLFNTTNVMEMAGTRICNDVQSRKGLEVTFMLDKEIKMLNCATLLLDMVVGKTAMNLFQRKIQSF